jgi:5-methylcytosine-specific restriction endonuclease McrA
MVNVNELKRFRLEHVGEPCEECDNTGFEAHHRIFRSRGGDDIESNLSWLCRPCHDRVHAGLLRPPEKEET